MAHPLAFNLIAILELYLGSLLFFSGFYSRAYRKDRTCFALNSDVAQRQKEAVTARCQKDLFRIKTDIRFLQMLSSALQDQTAKLLPESAPGILFISGLRFEFSAVCAGALLISTIKAIDEGGRTVRRMHIPLRSHIGCFEQIVNEGIGFWSMHQRRLEQRLETMSSDCPDILGGLDFLYFSAMIQTTAGTGDIVPSSSRIRTLTSLQAFLGYAMAATIGLLALR